MSAKFSESQTINAGEKVSRQVLAESWLAESAQPLKPASKESQQETMPIDGQHRVEKCGPPCVEVPVFFASDRKRITSNKDADGKTLAALQLGSASVLVPDQVRWNSNSGRGLADSLEKMGWRMDRHDYTLRPYIGLRGYEAEADTPAVLKNVHTDNNFWSELRGEASQSKDQRVYVYIPGFGSSGENSVYAAGVLASELEAPVVAFSWPSSGKIGSLFKPFGKHSMRSLFEQDRQMIDNPQVMNDLSKFLSNLKNELPPGAQIDLVAHSLGNRLLTRYLHSNASETFASVYFLAPDVDKKTFLSAVPDITRKAEHVELFMNPHDRVLAASGLNNLLELHSPKKAGRSKLSVAGIEFVDYGAVAQPRGVGHYLPFEQFGSLLRTNQPYSADPNQAQFILSRQTKIERLHEGRHNKVSS